MVKAQESIEGVWVTRKEQSHIQIYQEGETFQGKVVKTQDPEDDALGVKILRGFSKQGDVWVGEIYAPHLNTWFDTELRRIGQVLEVKVTTGFISRRLAWDLQFINQKEQ
ncbi:hypothetical protein GCM10023331_40190 [Algivirga pacifica]|uniref:DUF2147 domain-containing protein n=2 Tax=Algivirga pacifica TaxID=1162670 RepID=A0ABP9DMP1_9BACT